MSRRVNILALSVVYVLVSCATSRPLPAKDFESVELGATKEQVTESLGSSGRVQFKILVKDRIWECVGYSFARPYFKYYFVFVDNSLTAIHHAREFRSFEVINGREIETSWNTDEKIHRIISAPAQPIEKMNSALQIEVYDSAHQESDLNVVPAFLIAAPVILPFGTPQVARELFTKRRWVHKFDPARIDIGMPAERVESELGRPRFKVGNNAESTLAFGPVRSLRQKEDTIYLDPGCEKFWIAVSFCEGEVSRITSDDLFNTSEILRPENALGNEDES